METGVRTWRWRCWVLTATVLSVILPPAAASLSPSGINYEGIFPYPTHQSCSFPRVPQVKSVFRRTKIP
jgi:hypothetical protein